jgi:DNA-directed RNA polymerase subunit RPC12/RpoP
VDPSRPSLKIGFEAPKHLLMSQHHGVQCKVCGQSISTGIAELSLPIPVGPVHCPYCRQERFYLEQDRIEFDTENGLPFIDPA